MKKFRSIVFPDPSNTKRSVRILHWVFNLVLLLIWCAGLTAMSLWFSGANYGPELYQSYFKYPLIFFLNFLPVVIIAFLFFLVINRMWPAVLISAVLVLSPSVAEYFKVLYRGDPLMAYDFFLIGEAFNMSGDNYSIAPTPVMWIFFILSALFAVFAFFFMKAKISRRFVWIRPVGAAALILLCFPLYKNVYTDAAVYNKTIHEADIKFSDGYVLNETWNAADRWCSRGVLYPLIYTTTYITNEKPEGYNKTEAKEALASYASGDIEEDKKVNVICIMLESFSDFSKYSDTLQFEEDPYETFHELQSEGVSGSLVVNVFAGGTYNTERCFITGDTKMFAQYREPTSSYARYFKSQGYYTEYCHPYYGWFYARQAVENYFGFDAFHFLDETFEEPTETQFYQDSDLFPQILDYMEDANENGMPYFNQTVTMQNHGLYNSTELKNPDHEYIAKGDLSSDVYYVINNYFEGLNQTSQALSSLLDGLRSSDSPTVVVFFGDHKPYLGSSWSDGTEGVYDALGIDIDESTDEGFLSHYTTPWTIWANDSAKETLGTDFSDEDGKSFSPCFLMMKLFDECGYTGDSNINALRELYGYTDVISDSGEFRVNGELTDTLPDEAQAVYDKFLKMQYYRFADYEEE